MEVISLYIKVLEIFYERERPYFDAAEQPDIFIARYCSTLVYELWHVTSAEIQLTKSIRNSGTAQIY